MEKILINNMNFKEFISLCKFMWYIGILVFIGLVLKILTPIETLILKIKE